MDDLEKIIDYKIKLYIDHLKIESKIILMNIKEDTDNEIKRLNKEVERRIGNYSKKKKDSYDRQAEAFLDIIQFHLNKSREIYDELQGKIHKTNVQINQINYLISKAKSERFEYLDFLYQCTEIKSEIPEFDSASAVDPVASASHVEPELSLDQHENDEYQ